MAYMWLVKLHAKTADKCKYFLCSDVVIVTFVAKLWAILDSNFKSSGADASIKKGVVDISILRVLLKVCSGYSTPYRRIYPSNMFIGTLPAVCTHNAVLGFRRATVSFRAVSFKENMYRSALSFTDVISVVYGTPRVLGLIGMLIHYYG